MPPVVKTVAKVAKEVGELVGTQLERRPQIRQAARELVNRAIETGASTFDDVGRFVKGLGADDAVTNIVRQEYDALAPAKRVILKPEFATKLVQSAQRITTMPSGEPKLIETAKLMREIALQVPPSAGQVANEYVVLSDLLNLKTPARNILGNVSMAGLENVSQVVATGLDVGVSKLTGVRTKTLPNLPVQLQAAFRGAKQGYKEAHELVDLYNLHTKLEIPRTNAIRGRIGTALNRLLRKTLGPADRAFFEAGYANALNEQMRLAQVKVPTDAMKEIATIDGRLRVLQDPNVLSKTLTGLHDVLNFHRPFGFGTLLAKYGQTGGALLARGIEYSPLGFVNALKHGYRAVLKQPFNQKLFVEEMARAITGSGGLFGTGYALGKLGILTGRREEHRGVARLQREAGLGEYKINLSAFNRFALTLDPTEATFQAGDTQLSYDWLQPMALPIAMGVNFAQDRPGRQDPIGQAAILMDSVQHSMETIIEQPLLRGLKTLLRHEGFDGVFAALQTIPARAIPSVIGHLKSLVDNARREKTGTTFIEKAILPAQAKLPGISKTLPQQSTLLGKPAELYQNASNTLFNVFLNPAFVTKYQPTPEAELVLTIFRETGETTQIPREAPKTIHVKGVTIRLTGKQIVELQRFMGVRTEQALSTLVNNPSFMKKPYPEQAEIIGQELTRIGQAAKVVVLGLPASETSKKVRRIVRQAPEPRGALTPEQASQVELTRSP